ncbi:TetR/AcrR family transcriptional regulator [Thalassospira sp. SM2505]
MAARGRPRNFDRNDALDKALDLFWRHGYDNTSMADLSAAMALRPPSIYAAFGSKEGLFEEVVERYSERVGKNIWGNLDRFRSAREATRHLLVSTIETFSHPENPRGCMIVLAAPQPDAEHSSVARSLCERRKGNVQVLKTIYADAVRRGEIPRGADLDRIANYYVTVQHGLSIQTRDGMDRDALMAVADAAMATWPSLIKTSLASS